MYYATSDLHGYPLDSFLRLLDEARFGDGDTLFVLGDVIDRNGDGGAATLEWLTRRPNVKLILGNHESMLLSCAFLFEAEPLPERLNRRQAALLNQWLYNGARPTINALLQLRGKRPESLAAMLAYLRRAPLYARLNTDAGSLLMVHSGLGGFDPSRPLSDYRPDDLFWHRPRPDERYFDEILTILGHTPTDYFGAPRRMFVTPTWIDIDVGGAMGRPPMLLRLDDLTPIYADA